MLEPGMLFVAVVHFLPCRTDKGLQRIFWTQTCVCVSGWVWCVAACVCVCLYVRARVCVHVFVCTRVCVLTTVWKLHESERK